MAMFSVEANASWARLSKRYKDLSDGSQLRRDGLILWAMQEGQKEAVNQANIAIYNKPEPARSPRTGDLKKAIQTRKIQRGTDAGEVYLDKGVGSHGGFYYPKLREGPPEGWPTKTRPNYPQDPYWHNAKLLMSARMKARARQALKEYGVALKVG